MEETKVYLHYNVIDGFEKNFKLSETEKDETKTHHKLVSWVNNGEAEATNRLLCNGRDYCDAEENGTYDYEMQAFVVDEQGNKYQVCWIFEGKKYANEEAYQDDDEAGKYAEENQDYSLENIDHISVC